MAGSDVFCRPSSTFWAFSGVKYMQKFRCPSKITLNPFGNLINHSILILMGKGTRQKSGLMAGTDLADLATAIRDGEFVQSVYDTINTNEVQFLHLPLYGKSSLFARAAAFNMPTHDDDDAAAAAAAAGIGDYAASYSIKHYIYSTVKGFSFWKPSAPWRGYIAESSEEESKRLGWRDIVVAICGTLGTTDWIKDFSFAMTDFTCVQQPVSGAKVHAGFWSIYTSKDPTFTFGAKSMQDQISGDLLQRLIGADNNSNLPVRITIAGHSLGAALATLVACDVGCNVAPRFANVTVSAITFASPKVGNDAFKRNAEKHTASNIWRYRSIGDVVPSLPPSWPYPYVHVGNEVILDWAPSPYVSISSWRPFNFTTHNLELHMHVMAAEGGAAVYTATQLEELLAAFSLAPHGSTYVIADLCQMSAWDGQDRELIRRELEDAKNRLTEDQPAMEAFLREVYYIGLTRAAPEEEVDDHAVHDEPSPFDKRDYSLLNKSGDIVKVKYGIPVEWLIHPNKDMVWDPASHKWLTRVHRQNDIPTPDNPEYN